jgi:hypothetical protein
MKKLIDNSGEIHTYAELIPLTNPQHAGWYNFRVTTVYDAARNPNEEQVKFTWILDPVATQKLKELFNEL